MCMCVWCNEEHVCTPGWGSVYYSWANFAILWKTEKQHLLDLKFYLDQTGLKATTYAVYYVSRALDTILQHPSHPFHDVIDRSTNVPVPVVTGSLFAIASRVFFLNVYQKWLLIEKPWNSRPVKLSDI